MSLIHSPEPGSTSDRASDGDELEAEIEALSRFDLQELRTHWRKRLRTRPPEHLSRGLILRLLAYKLQARAYGDLDRETARSLDRIAKEQARQLRKEQGRRKAPPIPPVPTSRRFKEGTLLAREYEGHMHRVTVVRDGFAWNGSTYPSLSEIARLITGTRWSGPRFFGLRDRTAAMGRVEAGE